MRIAVHGASGRVGTQLVEAIMNAPQFELAAALVSPASQRIGEPISGTGVEYRAVDPNMNCRCDVVIDFSTPAASNALQAALGDSPLPVVVGTTGFSEAERAELRRASGKRPLLMGENLAVGFEAFSQAAKLFADLQPSAAAVVEEVYHARKKNAASGTSLRLARLVGQQSGSSDANLDVPIIVHRKGQTVGINTVHFDLGSTELCFTYTVHRLGAYAEGALSAAQWLADEAPGPGLYALADTLRRP